ncbi:MAG: 50S ribosomal protein L35 [Actinobacteria bacterium]|nr:50S ribosomal protein L35 [Actinomycetota bacterium]
MPKIKTHKGAAKRFRLSGTGKIIREKAYKSHILTKKNAERKRRLGKSTEVSAADTKKVKRLLGR